MVLDAFGMEKKDFSPSGADAAKRRTCEEADQVVRHRPLSPEFTGRPLRLGSHLRKDVGILQASQDRQDRASSEKTELPTIKAFNC